MSQYPSRLFSAWLLGGLLFFMACEGQPARGQPSRLSEQSEISLITVLPGDPVYTFAGHSAVRIRDPALNIDRLYNYGTFNFEDPFFILKFTYGYLRYFLSVSSYDPMLRFYEQQGRPVIEQPLNLSQSQRTTVFQYLQTKSRPENRYYQYNFFFDNCSTRIRDLLKKTLGEEVDFSGVPAPNRTFRQFLDPYVASRPSLDLGFDLSLGLPADQQPTAWERMFLPVQLLKGFNHASVSHQGTTRPLVARTDTVVWIDGYQAEEAQFDWPLALGVGILVLVVGWTGRQALTGNMPNGTGDALLLATIGGSGLVICYLWLISTYTVTDNNLNLLWAWPTHLFGAYMLLRRPSAQSLRHYLTATASAAFLFALGWPLWPQNFHEAVLPIVLATGIRTGWWALLLSGAASAIPFSSPSPPSKATEIPQKTSPS